MVTESSPPSDFVLLERFASVPQAELTRLQLADSGIDSVLLPESAADWTPADGAPLVIEVRVAHSDLAAACRVLRSATAAAESAQH
ncbi:MAG: hypothetical protein ACYTG2_07370 [Planctomycetota bacterium]